MSIPNRNNPASVLIGWTALIVASAATYYFARRDVKGRWKEHAEKLHSLDQKSANMPDNDHTRRESRPGGGSGNAVKGHDNLASEKLH